MTSTGIFIRCIVCRNASFHWLALSPRTSPESSAATKTPVPAAESQLIAKRAASGFAFTGAGAFYPFFAAYLGWLGVFLTGSDTASNALFGSLQRITAEQLHLTPVLIVATNSTGGVMGKMIDAQSIVVASTATNWFGHEGSILRAVFFHSIALACLVGVLVMLQAYVFPGMIVR